MSDAKKLDDQAIGLLLKARKAALDLIGAIDDELKGTKVPVTFRGSRLSPTGAAKLALFVAWSKARDMLTIDELMKIQREVRHAYYDAQRKRPNTIGQTLDKLQRLFADQTDEEIEAALKELS